MQKQPLKYSIESILFIILFLLLLGGAGAAGAGVYQQDPGANGIVSVEAEHFDTNVSQGGHSWTSIAPAGSSGTGAMETSPNNGTKNDTGYVSNSPRLDFPINFTRTGIHYVWIRGRAGSGQDDSVHVGLDGAAVSSSDRIGGFALGSWSWSKQTMDGPVATVNITTTGTHTLNLWMREDGFVVDKLLLTTNASYMPSGTGAPESPSGTTVGSATISWIPPTTKTDGTALTDLAGYTIHYGSSSGNYTTTIDVNSPGITSYVVQNLPSGTFYFAMTANDTAGNSSVFSNEASMVINN